MVDNQVLYHAWLREGCKNQGVNNALKSIFDVTLRENIALSLQWVPSALNIYSHRQAILRLLFGPPEHTASQNQNTCHFRGTCGPSESLEQITIESCRVLHLLSAATAALHSLETCPSSGMPHMSYPK